MRNRYKTLALALAFITFHGTPAAAARPRPPTPGTPTNLVAAATSPTTSHLLWNDNTVGEDGFVIERSEDGSTFNVVARVAANATTFDDSGLPDNTKLFYRVAAFDSSGKTAYSNVFEITMPQAFYQLQGRVVEGNDFSPVNGAVVSISRNANSVLPPITPNHAIPDNNSTGITESFNVPAALGTIDEMTVAIKINHPYISDLSVAIIHPDGTKVFLHKNTGGSGRNIDTVYPTTTVPFEPLTRFKGKPASGTWKIQVIDSASGDSGTLVSFQLSFTGAAAVTTANTDSRGYFAFSAVGSGPISVGVTSPGLAFTSRALDIRSATEHFNFVSQQ